MRSWIVHNVSGLGFLIENAAIRGLIPARPRAC